MRAPLGREGVGWGRAKPPRTHTPYALRIIHSSVPHCSARAAAVRVCLCAATVWLSPEAAREVWGTSEAAAVPEAAAAQAAAVAEVDAARRFKASDRSITLVG